MAPKPSDNLPGNVNTAVPVEAEFEIAVIARTMPRRNRKRVAEMNAEELKAYRA
jgi:hypothetical protein